ncbi:MAG: hypothetical protein NVS9B11_17150 [Candidatus Dormibacteraceae bacterium]
MVLKRLATPISVSPCLTVYEARNDGAEVGAGTTEGEVGGDEGAATDARAVGWRLSPGLGDSNAGGGLEANDVGDGFDSPAAESRANVTIAKATIINATRMACPGARSSRRRTA